MERTASAEEELDGCSDEDDSATPFGAMEMLAVLLVVSASVELGVLLEVVDGSICSVALLDAIAVE